MKLTIGMANWDDAEGAWWTLSSLRAHHVPASNSEIELLVIDDMPEQNADLLRVCAQARARYIHAARGQGPARAKDLIWDHALGRYVLAIDSHVLLVPGAVDYLMANAETVGRSMWVGPLLNESGGVIATELLPELRGDFFGVWHVEPNSRPVRPVHAHGSAFTFMAKDAWPGFCQHFRGFGGEEIYIHDRVRRQGGEVLLHMPLGWVHRFDRFGRQVTYPLTIEDKLRNYTLAAYEMGWNVPQFWDYFGRKVPAPNRLAVVRDLHQIYPGIFTSSYAGRLQVKQHD